MRKISWEEFKKEMDDFATFTGLDGGWEESELHKYLLMQENLAMSSIIRLYESIESGKYSEEEIQEMREIILKTKERHEIE